MTLWQAQEIFDGYVAAHGAEDGISEQEENNLWALVSLPTA